MTFQESRWPVRKHLPNLLSLFRIGLGLVIPAMLLLPSAAWHGWAALVFAVAALTDYYDGWLARLWNSTSDTGKWLDPLADKMLTLGCLWAFSEIGIIPGWAFVLVLIREVLITFCRTGWGLSGVMLGAEWAGKWKLVVQIVWIAFCFFYLFRLDGVPFFTEEFCVWLGASVVALTFLCIGMTWYSGVSFLKNNRALFLTPFFAKFVLAAGVGLIPKAPGTWGSMVGVLLAAATWQHGFGYAALFLLIAWLAYFFWEKFQAQFPKDPPFFVLDEVCGIFVTFAAVGVSWKNALPGFLLFRLFDIWKPFPIRYFDRKPGYWGIMMDDILAGIYAGIILWFLPLY